MSASCRLFKPFGLPSAARSQVIDIEEAAPYQAALQPRASQYSSMKLTGVQDIVAYRSLPERGATWRPHESGHDVCVIACVCA